jgi:carbon storage regulator
MLVLSRTSGQEIYIGENVVLKIVRVEGRRVRIGIAAPERVQILRGELAERAARHEEPSTQLAEPAAAE